MGRLARHNTSNTIEHVGSLLDDTGAMAEKICALAGDRAVFLWVTPDATLYVSRDEHESLLLGERIGTYVADSNAADVADDLLFVRTERTAGVIVPHDDQAMATPRTRKRTTRAA